MNVFDRIKLLFRKEKELYLALYRILGYMPRNIEHYKTALSHSSGGYQTRSGKTLNNERMEFLGDAVLEMIVSEIIYKHYPTRREGFLTSTRSKVVKRTTLNRLADEMGVAELIRAQNWPQSHPGNIGGNAFEAFVGAIYLDQGYRKARKFVENKILGTFLNLDDTAHHEENFKSHILEWTQKHHLDIDFQTTGTQNNFQTTLLIEGIKVGHGRGQSKKESHQAAARQALARLKRDRTLKQQIYTAHETPSAEAETPSPAEPAAE